MQTRLSLAVFLLAACASTPVLAAHIYKCVSAHGQVSFQDTPCSQAQRQQVLQTDDADSSAPAAAVSAPLPPMDDEPAVASSSPALEPPPVAIPVMYRCVKATDGSTYVSRHGNPAPYRVPLGIIGGYGQMPLAQVYGGSDAARVGMSAPELAPHASSALIGSNYTEVQDQCWPLTLEQTCDQLQRQADANQQALHDAFDDEKAPLVKRQTQLHRQLAGCPG